MRRRIYRRTTERVQRRPWLEALESRLTPSALLGGRGKVSPLQPSIQATDAAEAPALGARQISEGSLAPVNEHGQSRIGHGLVKHSDDVGFARKDESEENFVLGRGPAVTLTIQTDEVTVSIT